MRALAGALILAAGAAVAQEAPPSCSILGQVATSVWLNTIGAAGRADGPRLAAEAALLDDLTASYARLGCDMDALSGVFDCTLSTPAGADPRDAARACLATAGLAALEAPEPGE